MFGNHCGDSGLVSLTKIAYGDFLKRPENFSIFVYNPYYATKDLLVHNSSIVDNIHIQFYILLTLSLQQNLIRCFST